MSIISLNMKKIFKFLLPLAMLTTLAGCNQKTAFMVYDKKISDIEFYSTTAQGKFGEDYYSFIHLRIDQDRSFEFYHRDDSVNPVLKYHRIRKLQKYAILKFDYDYLYPVGNTYGVAKEKVEVAVYLLTDCLDEDNNQRYFMFGYNLPRIISSNEKIDNTYIEKHKVVETKTDASGKEFSVKSAPNFGGFELVKRHSKTAQWQDQEVTEA